MSALVLQAQMSRLMQKHGLQLPTPAAVPLAPPTALPLYLSGFASTCNSVDQEKITFAPFAFGNPLPSPASIQLLHNHETPAGKVDELYYDHAGNLMCRVTATDLAAARCNAFSIGSRVRTFEIKHADTPDFYALITKAEITDVSLVLRPVNPRAIVLQRERQPPPVEFYTLMQQRVKCLQQMTTILMETQNAQRNCN